MTLSMTAAPESADLRWGAQPADDWEPVLKTAVCPLLTSLRNRQLAKRRTPRCRTARAWRQL